MDGGLVWVRRREKFVEGGVYFLLLFCPFAFGAVEAWAIGIVQIVCGLVFGAWAWDRRPGIFSRGTASLRKRVRAERILWWSVGAFILLVFVQLLPLPSPVLRWLAPGAHDLYARTLPGFTAGRPYEPAALGPWLVEGVSGELPGPVLPAASGIDDVPAPSGDSPSGKWRTVSIYPFQTRSRLSLLLAYAALFAVITGTFHRREQLSRLFSFAIGSAFAVSLLGILQKLSTNDRLYWIREGDYREIFGPFVNRNSYAAFAGTVLPLVLCLALHAGSRFRRRGESSALPRLMVFGFSAVVIAGGIFYSLSRGGMVAAGLSVGIVAILLVVLGHRRLELLFLALMVVAAGGFILWVGTGEVLARVETLVEGSGAPTLAARVMAWGRAARLVIDHLFLGSGLGTFRFAIMRYSPPGHAWWTTAHNEYIEVLCDTGLLGGALVLVGLVAYGHRVWRPGLFQRSRRAYAWAGLIAGIVGLLLHSAISSNLQVPANAVLLVILGGGLLNLVRLQEGRRPRHSPGTPPGGDAAESSR